MIKFQNVCKSYKKTPVLKDINLEVSQGEVLSIIGTSGCGKSTFLKCINGLEQISTGKLIVDGKDLADSKTNLNQIRMEVGIVFQQFNLFPHMSVKENIILAPMKVKKESFNQASANAMELLEKVKLLDKMDKYPDELSGGQAQRVAIARSLAMRPKIMLFDEPTSALDPKMTREVLDVVKMLAKDKITMLVVTHEMGFAKEVANRVVFMNNGRILEDDTPKEVFENPKNEITRDFLNNIFDMKESK